MNIVILCITACALMLTLSACVTPVPLGILPKDDEAFRLPVEQLVKTYPMVEGLSLYPQNEPAPIYDRPITLDEIKVAWGEPVSSETNWSFEARKYGLVGIAIPLESAPVLGILAGIVTIISPTPPKNVSWEKGDYHITGIFSRTFLDKDRNLLAWNWKRKDTNSALQDILPGVRSPSSYFMMLFSTGGSVIAQNQDKTVQWHAGDSTRLLFGRNFPLKDRPLSVKFGAGYEYSGWGFSTPRGTRLSFFPVEAVVEYGEKTSSMRVGLGTTFAVAGNYHAYNFDGRTADLPLDLGFGPFIQVGFTPVRGGGSFGLRYSYLPLTGNDLPVMNAGGIAFVSGGFQF